MNAITLRQAELQAIAIIIGLCAGAFVVLGSALLAWMLYFDVDPPFVSVKARVLDNLGRERYVFRAGEVVQLRRDFCVFKDTPVQVGRYLRETETNTSVTIDSSNQIYRKGCFEGGNVIEIPAFAPVGRYKYGVTVRFSNNPLHDAAVELPPVYLEIVK